MEEIVYFELDNWFRGRDYPNAEPFISWMHDDLNIRFRNDIWPPPWQTRSSFPASVVTA